MATKKLEKRRAKDRGSLVLLAAVRSGAGPHRPRRERRPGDKRWLREVWA